MLKPNQWMPFTWGLDHLSFIEHFGLSNGGLSHTILLCDSGYVLRLHTQNPLLWGICLGYRFGWCIVDLYSIHYINAKIINNCEFLVLYTRAISSFRLIASLRHVFLLKLANESPRHLACPYWIVSHPKTTSMSVLVRTSSRTIASSMALYIDSVTAANWLRKDLLTVGGVHRNREGGQTPLLAQQCIVHKLIRFLRQARVARPLVHVGHTFLACLARHTHSVDDHCGLRFWGRISLPRHTQCLRMAFALRWLGPNSALLTLSLSMVLHFIRLRSRGLWLQETLILCVQESLRSCLGLSHLFFAK